jgi:predicted nucleotidyltransferase component of viral defense system
MIETSMDEKVLKPTFRRSVLHDYGESLEEIVAEKLRSILQHMRLLERRGWVRSRARDYYDLWRILGTYRDRVDITDFPAFLREKCVLKNVAFSGPESFFPEAMLPTVEKTWMQWLGPLVPKLPPYKTVIEDLRPRIAELLTSGK